MHGRNMATSSRELSGFQQLVHPYTLISVLTSSSVPSTTKELPVPLSGGGFILGEDCHGDSLVVTSASWLSGVIDIYLEKPGSHSSIAWKHGESRLLNIVVLMDTTHEGHSVPPLKQRGTLQAEADIVQVCLMSDVLQAIKEVLDSLSHWRVAVGEERVSGNAGKIISESLLVTLSCLVLLKLKTPVKVRPTYCSYLSPLPPTIGQSVTAVGTPFGAFCPEVFFNCVSSGIICKTLGRSEVVVFITDVNLPCGSGGSLVLRRANHYSESTVQGEILGLVIAELSSASGHPSGLSLCCSAQSVWKALTVSQVKGFKPPCSSTQVALDTSSTGLPESVVVVLKDGQWGSGTLLTDTIVLTCSHVVHDGRDVSIVTQHGERLNGEVLFSSTMPDYALIKLSAPVGHCCSLLSCHTTISRPSNNKRDLSDLTHPSHKRKHSILEQTNSCHPCPIEGQDVLVLGYGCQDPYKASSSIGHSPLTTRGSIIKVVLGESGEVVMFVTTAVLLPGMSGALVVDVQSGAPLGMAVSNSRDLEGDTSYPRLNYCLPLSWLLPPLCQFLSTSDIAHLQTLNSEGKTCSDSWNLKSKYSTDLYSKL